MTPDIIADRLGKTGLCVCPNYLSLKEWSDCRQDLDEIRASGGFRPARTGKESDGQSHRSDETHWLDRFPENKKQTILWERVDALKMAFNRNLFLGLKDFEGHYSIYPKGGFYQRHTDRFRDDNRRTVSLVLYLNRGWQEADGGRLRIFSGDGGLGHTDIDPLGGTLVCFFSAESEHEVLGSHQARFSFSGWFRT